MSKITRRFFWVLINISFAIAFYGGYFKGIEWLANIFKFFFWFNVISTISCYLSDDAKNRMREKGRAVPRFVTIFYDLSIIIVLAALGKFVLASFWMLQMGAEQSIYEGTK